MMGKHTGGKYWINCLHHGAHIHSQNLIYLAVIKLNSVHINHLLQVLHKNLSLILKEFLLRTLSDKSIKD